MDNPEVVAAPLPPANAKRSETLLAGPPGEELPDYSFRYHTDGSIRETAVYFYEGDCRAANARGGRALRREAVYLGQVDPFRLHGARKLSDTYYAGLAGHELRDRCAEYNPDGAVARTILFYYQDDRRASQASSGSVLRRQVSYEGKVE